MKSVLTLQMLLLASSLGAQTPAIRISGETTYEPHKMVRLKVEGAPARSLITWSVEPKASVEYPSKLDDDRLEFSADPGTYTVTMTADWRTAAGLQTQTATVKVTLKGCASEQAPPPRPDPNAPKPDPVAGIGRINFDGAGCTAIAIWPRRPDGKWDVFTAAHCVRRVGQKGRFALKDGRIFPVTVTVTDPRSDVAWLSTDESIPDMPYAILAAKAPERGTRVWHAGYGWDRPGNRKEGEVVEPLRADGRTSFMISFSQGDSGGPQLRADNNEVVASACCTTGIAVKALAFGGSCETAWRLRPVVKANVQDDPRAWAPTHMPIVNVQGEKVAKSEAWDWKPAEIPQVKLDDKGNPVMPLHK